MKSHSELEEKIKEALKVQGIQLKELLTALQAREKALQALELLKTLKIQENALKTPEVLNALKVREETLQALELLYAREPVLKVLKELLYALKTRKEEVLNALQEEKLLVLKILKVRKVLQEHKEEDATPDNSPTPLKEALEAQKKAIQEEKLLVLQEHKEEDATPDNNLISQADEYKNLGETQHECIS